MASGETLLTFSPLCGEEPSSNPAEIEIINARPVLSFNGGVNESVYFTGIMPQNYAGGGVTVYLHWASDETSNDVDWDVAFERIGDQVLDIDGDSFAAANSVNGTSTPAVSHAVDIVSVAFTDGADMDSVAAGELFRMSIKRDAVSDASAVDAQIVSVEIRET